MADDEFDFKTFENEIRSWTEKATPEFRSSFASDCAARALPNIFGGTPKSTTPKYIEFSFDLTLIRAIISSQVRALDTSTQIEKSLSSAGSAAKSAYANVIAQAQNSISVAHATDAAAYCADAGNSAYSAASAAFTRDVTSALCAKASTYRLENGGIENLFPMPLWLGFPVPEKIETNWSNLKSEWSTDPAMAFWIGWYEGRLAGTKPDWALWHDIVLIDDAIWDAGPKDVAREIEILQAAHSLDGTIGKFETQLLRLASEPIFDGNRGNGGPPLEDTSARLQTIELIKAQLEILKAERDKISSESDEEPDPEVIKSAIQKIVAFVKEHLVIFLLSGSLVTGAVTKIGADAIDHYNVSHSIFELVDDLAASGLRLADKLLARPKVARQPKNSTQTIDL